MRDEGPEGLDDTRRAEAPPAQGTGSPLPAETSACSDERHSRECQRKQSLEMLKSTQNPADTGWARKIPA